MGDGSRRLPWLRDGRRKDVLEAAGIREAKVVAVCTRDKETTDRIVELIQAEYPNVKLYVRSYDRTHTLQLRARGVVAYISSNFATTSAIDLFGSTQP